MSMRPASAKIIQHAEGMGTPDLETVRKRAHEIALIAGRNKFNEDDWREATRELHGGHESNSGNQDIHMESMISEHDMVACDTGHHVENMPLEDGVNISEELLAEGMDEALHDQMLAARRQEPRDSE
jgi:Protein of unknown function (DUF2934)